MQRQNGNVLITTPPFSNGKQFGLVTADEEPGVYHFAEIVNNGPVSSGERVSFYLVETGFTEEQAKSFGGKKVAVDLEPE